MADSEKIGTSVYFWAFPSKASQAKKRKLKLCEEQKAKVAKKLEELESDVKIAECGRVESDERQELLENLKKEKEQKDETLNKLKEYADNDPAMLEQMAKDASLAVQAVNRWTDNIFSIQSWIRKKFPSVDQTAFCKQFGIPEDLDYIESK